MLVAKNCINKEIVNLNDILSTIDYNMFPNLYKLLQAALTIPISSASCERSFSVMRRINTWIRSTMSNDRFSNLSILHIERDLSSKINTEDILNIFNTNKRRIDLGQFNL